MKHRELNNLAMLAAFEDIRNKLYTEEVKNSLRADLTITGNEYITIKRSKQPATSRWKHEDKVRMEAWAIQHGLTPIVTPEKPNHKIELTANANIMKQLIKMLKTVVQHGDKTTATLAQDLLTLIEQ